MSIRTGIIFALIILFFIYSFFPFTNGEIILGIITFIVTLLSLPRTKGIPRLFGTSMLVIGSMILLTKGSSLMDWTHSIIKNLPLVTLIVLSPILTIPITLGKYDEQIEKITNRYRNKPSVMFFVITLVFYLISPILNLGSIRLIHSMLAKLNLPKEFLGKVYLRGFTAVIGWSPYFAAVLLIIDYVDIPITSYLPYGLIIIGISQLIIGNLLFFFIESKKFSFPNIEGNGNGDRLKVLELFLIFMIMTSIVFTLEHYLHINMMVLISLLVVIFPILWSLYLKSFSSFIEEIDRYRKDIVPRSANEVVLFISAGFFGVVLSDTIIGEYLNQGLSYISNYSVLLVIFLTIFITSVLAMIGVHQIVTLTSVASSVLAVDLGLENVTFALTLMSGWAIATMVSPVTPVNVTVTSLLNESFFKLTLKWNGIYAVFVLIVHTILIYSVHLLLM